MNSPSRCPYALGVVRRRIPDGFCPPFQCQSGIMAKSTMHQAKAIVTHTFSALCAGFHQIPFGHSRPVCVSRCMAVSSGKAGCGKVRNLPESPAGVQDEHHEQPCAEQQKKVVKQSLSEWDRRGRGGRDGWARTISHRVAPRPRGVASDRGHHNAHRPSRVMTLVIPTFVTPRLRSLRVRNDARVGTPGIAAARAADAAANRLYGTRWNPLYQSGTIVVALYLTIVATGL